MTFEEWFTNFLHYEGEPTKDIAQAVWNYQQKIIDGLKQANNDLAKAAIRPDGYVLVPVEPTDVMQKAGYSAVMFAPADTPHLATVCYKAMLEAAQEEE